MFSAMSIVIILLFSVTDWAPQWAIAAPIPGLFNTGVDDSGAVLPAGSAEMHYAMVGPVSPAQVIPPHPAWVLPPDGSAWIGPSDGSVSGPEGDYTYTLSFDLSGLDPTTAVISGDWATDNSATILLNGVTTGVATPDVGFTVLTNFVIADGFVPGLNTLAFIVTNIPASGNNPTGLLVANLSGTAETSVAITAVLERPQAGQIVAGGALIQGWAFGPATNPISLIELFVDGQLFDVIPFGSQRGDVADAFPAEPNALFSGFGISTNYGLFSPGPHTLTVRITNQTGQELELTHQITVLNFGGFEFAEVDLSGASVHLEGNEIVIAGALVTDLLSSQQTTVTLRLAWQTAAQGFVVTDIQ